MITYEQLLSYLKQQREYPTSIRKNYFVVIVRGSKYHVTVFQDQWNEYENVTGQPYHLFHISSDDEANRCSSYFWVDKQTYRIKKIPAQYFKYNQPTYDYFSSTRSPCSFSDIKFILKIFQRILRKIFLKNA